jgi:hypothetical protein
MSRYPRASSGIDDGRRRRNGSQISRHRLRLGETEALGQAIRAVRGGDDEVHAQRFKPHSLVLAAQHR